MLLSTVFIRSVILYVVVIFAVRLMGKRQLGELQPSELVITILISNIATLPLENPSVPIITGVLPILALVCFEIIVSRLCLGSKKLRKLISGSPKIIIRGGKIAQQTMRELRLTVDDLLMALRNQQIFNPEEVEFAIVETTGSISVYPKSAYRELTQQDAGFKTPDSDPPSVVISDGIIIEKALTAIGRDKQWLQKQLVGTGLTTDKVFLAMTDGESLSPLIAKEVQS